MSRSEYRYLISKMQSRYRYLMNKTTNDVGVADLPNWLDFNEQPPRSFEMWSYKHRRMVNASTNEYVEITKEVADIMRGV